MLFSVRLLHSIPFWWSRTFLNCNKVLLFFNLFSQAFLLSLIVSSSIFSRFFLSFFSLWPLANQWVQPFSLAFWVCKKPTGIACELLNQFFFLIQAILFYKKQSFILLVQFPFKPNYRLHVTRTREHIHSLYLLTIYTSLKQSIHHLKALILSYLVKWWNALL